MKKFLFFTVALSFWGIKSEAQTVVYSENFGTITANDTPVATHTFQNTNITYTAVTTPTNTTFMARLRDSSPSTGYTGASGDACVFIPGTVAATVQFIIEGIDTSEYENLELTLGQYKGIDAANNELVVEISEDGTNWTELTYTRSTGTGTSNWELITPQGTIPSTNNLSIRFTNDANTSGMAVGFRIDDVKITGTEIKDVSVETFKTSQVKLYPNPVTNGILNLEIENTNDVNVELFDITGKKVFAGKTINNSIDVSSVKSGIYFIKVLEVDKFVTQKLIIK